MATVRRLILTETVDDFGNAELSFEQEGGFTVPDLERILKNALFGVEKTYERKLAGITQEIVADAGRQIEFRPDFDLVPRQPLLSRHERRALRHRR